jgi:hypothetical protein
MVDKSQTDSPSPSDPPTRAQVTPGNTTPARKPVVFNATNTVVEDVIDGADSSVVICQQLAPVFVNTSKRKMTLFLKVRLPVESKPKDPTSAA